MIQIVLLIGFLGAGKTTLLQSLLKSYKDKKIGVVVNEFGEVNVDARLIRQEGIEMAELSNGSVFCACIKDKFVDSLIELSKRDLEYLFIEASGLADPANMGQILSGIRHKTEREYALSGSICVVDAVHFLELVDMLPALANQVEYANAVIINKADMTAEDAIKEVSEKIRGLNPGASQFVTSYCKTDIREVAETFGGLTKESKDSSNTYETRPSTFVLKAGEALPYEGLLAFLREVAQDSYRIKGFAETDRGPIEISAVAADIHMNKWDSPIRGAEIVAISSVGVKLLSRMAAASKTYLEGKLKL